MSEHLYQTISNQLRRAIISGEYNLEEMLPSENELSRRYQTSRVTIRKALAQLENERLVRPLHGKGYFVERPRHTNYTLDFVERSEGDSVRYRRITVIKPSPEVCEALAILPDRRVIYTRSIVERGEHDTVTIACDEKYIPYERGIPTVEREIDYAEFAELFTDKFPPMSIWIEMDIDIEFAPEDIAEEIGCTTGEKLLVARRVIRSQADRRVGYAKRWFAPGIRGIEARSGYFITGRL